MKDALNFINRFFGTLISIIGGPSMVKFLIRRFLAAIPVLFAIMVVTFALIHSMPGGPFDRTLNQRSMPPAVRQQLQERYGLDKSVFFDSPANGSGAETMSGKQTYIKGGYGENNEGSFEALEGTGIAFYDTYKLYRWDDVTHEYRAYEEAPYKEWAKDNGDITRTVDMLSVFSANLSGMPVPAISAVGISITSESTNEFGLDQLYDYVEDCRLYRPWPGWSLFSKRQECLTGDFGSNEARDLFRIDPLDTQFWGYLWNVLNLDFGPSLNIAELRENRQVADEISARLPISMRIGVVAVIFGFSLGIPLGVMAAIYHNTVIDFFATFVAVIGQSTPSIVLAPLLIIILAVQLKVLPTPDRSIWTEKPFFSRDYLVALIMPTVALGTGMSAGIARLTRASLLQVLSEDYIRTARAKGLRERTVVYLHALKNSLIPVATILGPLLAGILTGTFVIELIFLIPGLGQSFINSVGARDYTTIMAVTLLYSTFLIAGNILVDIMYTWLDPRIRFD
ncbi:MAG: ABC transporter permease [Anaerolineales bacterium]|nr:ABC transporter permease [Anaerolineales bacterium]